MRLLGNSQEKGQCSKITFSKRHIKQCRDNIGFSFSVTLTLIAHGIYVILDLDTIFKQFIYYDQAEISLYSVIAKLLDFLFT